MFRATPLSLALLSAVLLCCAGCGSGIAEIPPASLVAAVPGPFKGNAYHAYGDSITYGAALSSPSTQNYAYLVAQDYGFTFTNYAISGREACDLPYEEIFPNGDAPTLNNGTLYSILISTNDVNVSGAGAYEAVFNLCDKASIAWLAVPEEYKVRATAPAVTVSGATHLDTSNNWNARVTDASGASLTFPVTLATTGPIYVWYRIIDGNSGKFSITVDGVSKASLATATSPAIATAAGATNSLALLRIPAISSGAHALVVTQTSAGPAGAAIVAIGTPLVPGASGLPRVLVGTTPQQLKGGNSTCGQNDSLCQRYIADIKTNIALFIADRLDVRIWDSRKYTTGTTADLADTLHPNTTGQLELKHAFEDSLN